MDYKDYLNNKDIAFAIMVLEKDLFLRKSALEHECQLTSPQLKGLYEDVHCISSAINKIKSKFEITL